MKRKGGIAFIVALVIGITLLGIVIFIVYEVLKGGSWDCVKCKTEFTAWCTNCFLVNALTTTTPSEGSEWVDGTEMGQELYECVVACSYWVGATGADQNCMRAEDPCRPFIIYTE